MMNEDEKHYKAVINGRRNKAVGDYFEQMVDYSCEYYARMGRAVILKTPEPLRPIRRLQGGQFVAIFTKMAQPDYKGVEKGGRCIIFDAKNTETGKLRQEVVTTEQEKLFNQHEALGAECFILASFGFERFFKIPWETFRQMKERYGRKYVTPKDIPEYEIRREGGVLKFLTEEG